MTIEGVTLPLQAVGLGLQHRVVLGRLVVGAEGVDRVDEPERHEPRGQ